MPDGYHEYEFTLPDGSKTYEIIGADTEVFRFMRMHKAIAARPVPRDPEGDDA